MRDAFGLLQLPLRSMTAEASLAERLGRGDGAALAEAYDAHHDHVRAFACRLVGNESEAEDLVEKRGLR